MLVVLGDVVTTLAGVALGFFFPCPGVGDVCVGPRDDERQDEDGYDDDGANACGCGAHGCASVVMVVASMLSEVGVNRKCRVRCEAECRSTGIGGEPDDAGVDALEGKGADSVDSCRFS